MRRTESPPGRLVRMLSRLLPVLLGGCLSGTSTDTDNTVVLTGRVLLSDGRPAACAEVTARSGDLILAPDEVGDFRSGMAVKVRDGVPAPASA